LKARLDRLLESIAQRPSLTPPSILSFLLKPRGPTRTEDEPQQQITIPRETDLVELQMKIDQVGSFQAAIRAVGGPQAWSQRSLKPRSAAITVTVPADKLPENDYILTLSATTPTGEPEEINRYAFRVLRK
jgi:hypothetical protein